MCYWISKTLNFIFLRLFQLVKLQEPEFIHVCLLAAGFSSTTKSDESKNPCSWAFELSAALKFFSSITWPSFLGQGNRKRTTEERMAVAACAGLFGYYLKLRKRPNMSLRARNPHSFTASPGFKNTKEHCQHFMSQVCWSETCYLKRFFGHFMLLGSWAR